jgi:DNA-binding PadR family transcriptional regulator
MPRGISFTAVTVLHAIASGARHGFDVMDTTQLPSGTVYPALGRLERDGLVKSAWEDAAAARAEKRPPRRNYRLTAQGTRVLENEVAKYRALGPVRPGTPVKARG